MSFKHFSRRRPFGRRPLGKRPLGRRPFGRRPFGSEWHRLFFGKSLISLAAKGGGLLLQQACSFKHFFQQESLRQRLAQVHFSSKFELLLEIFSGIKCPKIPTLNSGIAIKCHLVSHTSTTITTTTTSMSTPPT